MHCKISGMVHYRGQEAGKLCDHLGSKAGSTVNAPIVRECLYKVLFSHQIYLKIRIFQKQICFNSCTSKLGFGEPN